jgi:hypothetical protein
VSGTAACHRFGTHLRAVERTCGVHPDAITWREAGGARGRLECARVRRVQLRQPVGMGVPGRHWPRRCDPAAVPRELLP